MLNEKNKLPETNVGNPNPCQFRNSPKIDDEKLEIFQDEAQLMDSVNYAIFFMGACDDDNFNEKETREHLFVLRILVELIYKHHLKFV
jgi:hypothetical protein